MWLQLVVGFVIIGLAIFMAAGTFTYWQAWAYLCTAAVSGVLLDLYVMKDPILLENRTKAGPAAEKRAIQKLIVLCAGIPGTATFIVPALGRRFSWSTVLFWLSLTGDLLILVGMWHGMPGVQREFFWFGNRRDRQ
jgi:protein-S-isoprenylcysteine O-methyltransferase Ste14